MSDPVIWLTNVSKTYLLHNSPVDQMKYVFNLKNIGLPPSVPPEKFEALHDISLQISAGEKVGIVGRNGSGKSTLLKIISENKVQTSGRVRVQGTTQALHTAGYGFDLEMTGRENVMSSLQNNSPSTHELDMAVESIVDFCELGEFFDQPAKTYSAGMLSRLMFAVATEIKPNILIVDEVLGAGDGYFIAKSRNRVEKLISNGCTMLLVSHSMSQVLELCDRVLWLHKGRLIGDGDAFDVIKKYEAFLNGSIDEYEINNNSDTVKQGEALHASISASDPQAEPDHKKNCTSKKAKQKKDEFIPIPLDQSSNKAESFESSPSEAAARVASSGDPDIRKRTPNLQPISELFVSAKRLQLIKLDEPIGFDFPARGGIQRWKQDSPLEFVGFTMLSNHKKTNKFLLHNDVDFVMQFKCLKSGTFILRYALVITDFNGRIKVKNLNSTPDVCSLKAGDLRTAFVSTTPLLLGGGDYVVSIGLYEFEEIEKIEKTVCYDILSRSFEFNVHIDDSLLPVAAEFDHPSNWSFGH